MSDQTDDTTAGAPFRVQVRHGQQQPEPWQAPAEAEPTLTDARLQELIDQKQFRVEHNPQAPDLQGVWRKEEEALRELLARRAECPDCRTNPTRKVGEEKEGMGNRHNLTAQLCEACFRRLMGDEAVTAADEFDAQFTERVIPDSDGGLQCWS
jgi:hypothetical protein